MANTQCGYIKLYRNFLDWGWYTDPNTVRLFIHCLFKANFKEREWHGMRIPVGSFATSYKNLAQELKLTVQKVRSSLNKLKSTGEITIKTTACCSIISIKNYSAYQTDNTQNNKQLTNPQHTFNKQLTTTKERNKEIMKESNIDSIFKRLEEKARKKNRI